MKRVNIDGENLHIFWTTWRILIMTLSGKMWFMIILKLKLKKRTSSSLLKYILEKPGDECQTEPPVFWGLKH